ncbi:hypothetical protein HU755_14530 [Pseudomonas sp. SWRI111]|uniref:hypothetical protein n=1 Tax=Pseudomonas sp. SWRI111 TaxID=2745507 RepID=UPI0016448052|nr:hypothetical protein [Pseudomonas sp. SWRI111]MBC3208015.1 hypothetical protein [Pseudomonas sp. SWRI111]
MNDNIDDSEKSESLPDKTSNPPKRDVSGTSQADASFEEINAEEAFSEVSWDDAVTTTIHQTHPRVPQLTTQLECQYKFENARLYVKTLRYKMTTRYGNWNRANIDLYLYAHEVGEIKSPDSLSQDAQWHLYENVISVPYRSSAAGGLRNRMNIRVDYDGTNNDVEPHEGWGLEVYPAATPIIANVEDGDQVPDTFVISGYNGLRDGRIRIYLFYGSESELGVEHVFSDGSWFSTVRFPASMEQGYLSAEQQVGNETSTRSRRIRIKHYIAPKIDYPPPGSVFLAGSALKVKGVGTPGRDIDVMKPGGSILHASAKVEADLTWEGDFNSKNYPNGGQVDMTAGHRGLPDWTLAQTFVLLGLPIIEAPVPSSETDRRGPISGFGVPGANVEVFKDLNHAIRIGQAQVRSDSTWKIESFENDMTPGPFSIVARQSLSTITTDVGEPRGFKVRPPMLDVPDVTYSSAGTVIFNGTGHHSPDRETQVQFAVKSGSGTAPPNAVVKAIGTWETTATDWSFGSYTVEVIQKIGDGANGWIESLPLTLDVEKALPDVSDVGYTKDYQPTFSGKGHNGATVQPRKPNSADLEAPAVVVASGQWSSKALAVWGPVFEREVHIKQVLDEHESPNWVVLKVTIPPLAPGLEPPVEEGLSPFFKGTCWPGATVNITFSDDPTSYAATVQGELWTFRRSTDFDPGVHTVSVTQRFAEQDSLAADATFTVQIPMLKPRITAPAAGDEVGSDVEICGNNGMQFATMQLYNALFDRAVGNPLHLENSGEWRITLSDLEFGQFTVYAVQTLDSRDSERSENHALKVVLLPPRITTPEAGGKLAREAALEGTGRAGGWVDVWLDGDDEPLQRNITVGWNSLWRREVELPVGSHTLRVRQSFDDNGTVHESACTDWMSFDVVPAAPFIETPVEGEAIGRQAVVSGFGVPGDTVTVTLAEGARSVLASTIVREDRTWSVMCDCAAVAGGRYQLQAVASLDTFESVEARRAVVLGIFLPILDEPAPGSWVVHPLQFAGRGRQGIGTLVSWYNPEVLLAPELAIVGGQWRGESIRALPEGGNWYRFRQTITDGAAGETISARVVSARFEVELTRAPGKYR